MNNIIIENCLSWKYYFPFQVILFFFLSLINKGKLHNLFVNLSIWLLYLFGFGLRRYPKLEIIDFLIIAACFLHFIVLVLPSLKVIEKKDISLETIFVTSLFVFSFIIGINVDNLALPCYIGYVLTIISFFIGLVTYLRTSKIRSNKK